MAQTAVFVITYNMTLEPEVSQSTDGCRSDAWWHVVFLILNQVFSLLNDSKTCHSMFVVSSRVCIYSMMQCNVDLHYWFTFFAALNLYNQTRIIRYLIFFYIFVFLHLSKQVEQFQIIFKAFLYSLNTFRIVLIKVAIQSPAINQVHKFMRGQRATILMFQSRCVFRIDSSSAVWPVWCFIWCFFHNVVWR